MLRPFFILMLIFPIFCFGQVKNIGTPYIQNYPKTVYKAGTQNWGIAQDKNGFMYFANNNGLLRFDGLNWDLNKVSPISPVRSVFIDSQNNIYVGLINDFGIIRQEGTELPSFKSLKDLLPPEAVNFEDIWKIYEIPQGIVFQCFKYIFILENGKITLLQPQKYFHFSFYVQNRLFVQEPGIGLFEYRNGKMEKLQWSESIKNSEITSILDIGETTLLIGTSGSGMFKLEDESIEKWETPASKRIDKYKLYCATAIGNNYIVFGTVLNGLVISDVKGNIIQEIDRRKGLENNTVLSVFSDKSQNLWLGLDNGIDFIEINSPVTFINNFESMGTGYCCRVFKGNLYLGTNQGLYFRPFENLKINDAPFELIKNTAGQVWSLEIVNGQLICGHNSGTFIIDGSNAKQIGNEDGSWKFIQLKNNPDFLLGGNYKGLVLLKEGENGWDFYRKVFGFNESSRYLEQDKDGNIWVGHGSKGVYRLNLSEKLDTVKNMKLYTADNGLPSGFNNILFVFKNRVYVSSVAGIYEYEKSSDTFIISEDLTKLFTVHGRIKSLQTDSTGNIWFIAENESGIIRINEDLTITKIASPFAKLQEKYVNEFESVYPYNDDNTFIGIDNGFAHYTSNFPKSYSQSFPSFIIKIELPYLDSVIYFSNSKTSSEYKFPFRKNTIRFHFSSPFYENSAQLEFSYFLDGHSEEWSDWSTDGYKDFTNLFEGEYQLNIKAKNIYGFESEKAQFQFVISPPWYRSMVAYGIYVLLLAIFTLALVKFVIYRINLAKLKEKIRHDEELKRKEEQYQIQAIVAEKEIIKLRNEKLREEKLFRDKELANQTNNIIQKNKFLVKLSEELRLLQNSSDDSSVRTKITILKRKITKEAENDQQNKIFETYFDEVHEVFFNRLKEKYPQLSPNDLRLCAYIKMNLSTKEISTLLNISYRGVEISRYRLRKKMSLSRDMNLSTYLVGM